MTLSLLAEALARRPLRSLLDAAKDYQAATSEGIKWDDVHGVICMSEGERLARSRRVIRLMAWDASRLAAQERRRLFHIVKEDAVVGLNQQIPLRVL